MRFHLRAAWCFACDAFDAMTRDRPWRSAFEPWDAIKKIRRGAGHQFDPTVVDALTATLREQRVSTPFSGLDTTVRGRRSQAPVPSAPSYAGRRPGCQAPHGNHPDPCCRRSGDAISHFGRCSPRVRSGRFDAGIMLVGASRRTRAGQAMAKDTEKLIRQLSLISFLMAERRPVSALEIKQDVEGYSEMNDDAFARRFYADRAELEALGST